MGKCGLPCFTAGRGNVSIFSKWRKRPPPKASADTLEKQEHLEISSKCMAQVTKCRISGQSPAHAAGQATSPCIPPHYLEPESLEYWVRKCSAGSWQQRTGCLRETTGYEEVFISTLGRPCLLVVVNKISPPSSETGAGAYTISGSFQPKV